MNSVSVGIIEENIYTGKKDVRNVDVKSSRNSKRMITCVYILI